MKHNASLCALTLVSTALAAPVFAQPRPSVPPAIPAIETHLQQQRTLNQREAMEAKDAETTGQPGTKPATPKKKSAKKKRATAGA